MRATHTNPPGTLHVKGQTGPAIAPQSSKCDTVHVGGRVNQKHDETGEGETRRDDSNSPSVPVLALLDSFLEGSAPVQLSTGRVKISQPMLITTGVRVPHTHCPLQSLATLIYMQAVISGMPSSQFTLVRYLSVYPILVGCNSVSTCRSCCILVREGRPTFPRAPAGYASRVIAYQAGRHIGSP